MVKIYNKTFVLRHVTT